MEEKGVWRTISGRRVFIKEGQDLESAMADSGKFNDVKTTSDNDYIYNNFVNDPKIIQELERNVQAREFDDPDAKVGDTALDSDRIISNYGDRLTTKEYSNFKWDVAEERLFNKLQEIERKHGFKE